MGDLVVNRFVSHMRWTQGGTDKSNRREREGGREMEGGWIRGSGGLQSIYLEIHVLRVGAAQKNSALDESLIIFNYLIYVYIYKHDVCDTNRIPSCCE